jgi:hypothetical protein
MSTRGIRSTDLYPGANNVRVHLLREGTEDESLCGEMPVRYSTCPDCAIIVRGGPEASRLAARLAAGELAPNRHISVRHSERRVYVHVHEHDEEGKALCGGRGIHLAPCSLCLRMISIHIAAPWNKYNDCPRTACGAVIFTPELLAALPDFDSAHTFPADRVITVDEAQSWVENDSDELWRLCRQCEHDVARHLRHDVDTFARIEANRAIREARAVARAAQKSASAERRREARKNAMNERAGDIVRERLRTSSGRYSRSGGAFIADPSDSPGGPGVDPKMAALAAKHAAAAAVRKQQLLPVADEED